MRPRLAGLLFTSVFLAPSLAAGQTSVSAGAAGAVYRPSDSFELPGVGAVLGELGNIEHEARPGLDVAVGGRLSPMLRGAIAFAWRPTGEMTATVGQLQNSSEIASYALFLDGVVDLPQWRVGRVTPFVGGGAGVTWNTYHDNGTGLPGGPPLIVTGDNSDTYFAWRAGAGVSIGLSSAWALDAGWQYSDYASVAAGTRFTSHIPGIVFTEPVPQGPNFTLAANEIKVSVRREFGQPKSGPALGERAPAASGAYVRFDAGGTTGLDPGLVIDQLDFPLIVDFIKSYHVNAGAGYRVNAHWRGDVTVSAMPALRQFSYQRAQPIGAADLSSVALMVSGYYDIHQAGALTPYVGGGLGPSWNRYGDLTITGDATQAGASIPGRTTVHLAFQVGGGVSTHLGSGWSIDLGYQYVNRGDYTNQPIAFLTDGRVRTDLQSTGRLASNDVHLGLRYSF